MLGSLSREALLLWTVVLLTLLITDLNTRLHTDIRYKTWREVFFMIFYSSKIWTQSKERGRGISLPDIK